MEKIFYNYQNKSSFIAGDLIIIKSKYKIIDFAFKPQKKIFTPFFFIKQLFFIFKYYNEYSIIFSHMGGYHTFLPSVLSKLKLKKHVIILHGTECNVIPTIKYGNLLKNILGPITKFSISNATLLLPVSSALINSQRKYESGVNCGLGLSLNMPNIKTPFKVIPNGVNSNLFKITDYYRAPKSLLTIALNLEKEGNVILKGVDLILEFAKNNPDYSITVLGSESVFQYNNDLPNVTLIGRVEHSKLYEYYNQHKFYLQLSLSESFGLSLCESILCGCIPIVSNTGIMPEIIQNYGFVLFRKNIKDLENLLNDAAFRHKNDTLKDMDLRASSIRDNYSFEKREKALLETITTLLT